MFTEEATLVRRCLRGDADAVATLVERYQGVVFGLCFRLLSHRQDAEDVCQEVFLRVFRSLRRWDSKRPLKPWILGIAVNRCRTWVVQRARRPEPVDYLQETAIAPEPGDYPELVQEIQSALRHLRPDFREVFVLYHEQGQSYEDIARVLDCPVGTVKTWLHRARLEVLQRLQNRGMAPLGEQNQKT